jgi:hypothetical protein
MTLLPGDPGVFKALASKKTNAPPCWDPSSFSGIEVASAADSMVNHLGDEPNNARGAMMFSLEAAGLYDFDTGEFTDGFDNPDDEDWSAWKAENGMAPDSLTEPFGTQDINPGDIHIGLNELLLTDADALKHQEKGTSECTSEGCNSNAMTDCTFAMAESSDFTWECVAENIEFTGNSSVIDMVGRCRLTLTNPR